MPIDIVLKSLHHALQASRSVPGAGEDALTAASRPFVARKPCRVQRVLWVVRLERACPKSAYC
jgi:hypothetical protein